MVAAGWAALLAAIGRHRVFVSNDTLSNYVHVWWIAAGLRHGRGLLLHMPVLGHGRAVTYPYAFLPWTAAALAWPVFGEHAVTLALVLGCAAMIAAMFWAFPALLENPWLAAAALANPVLVAVAILGQLPFAWGVAALFAAIGLWRRGRVVGAILAAAVAEATHPAVVLPIAALVVAVMLVHRYDRRLVRAFAVSVLLALPAASMVVASPVFSDTSVATKVAEFLVTVGVRLVVVVVPAVLVWFGRRAAAWLGPVLLLLALVLNAALIGPLDTRYAWRALSRQPDRAMLSFIASSEFVPGRTYRVLRAADGKVGMYQLVQHGARLDSELFPESIDRRSFRGTGAYGKFLEGRRVDVVLDFTNYDRFYRTNEHQLLDQLAVSGACGGGITVTRFHHDGSWDGYRIDVCR